MAMGGNMAMAGAARPFPAAARLICCAFVLTASAVVVTLGAVAYAQFLYHVPCIIQSSFLVLCVELTDADHHEQSGFWIGLGCCAALHLGAAALALLLPCTRRVHGALAYSALALAAGCLLLTGEPGHLSYRIVFRINCPGIGH